MDGMNVEMFYFTVQLWNILTSYEINYISPRVEVPYSLNRYLDTGLHIDLVYNNIRYIRAR